VSPPVNSELGAGRLTRRAALRGLASLALAAPMAARLAGRPAVARAHPAGVLPRRGGGGPLRIIRWTSPTLLNPHLVWGAADEDACRLFYEPLATYRTDGSLIPILAVEVPDAENGGIAPDGTWVIWRLRRDVSWHDGRPFTADDVVFNWEYGADSAIGVSRYADLDRVEKLGDHAVRVVFREPTPFWAGVFCGSRGMLVPKHVFAPYRGQRAREAPANLRPVGTGPYRIVEFRPGDVVRAEANPGYRVPGLPVFDTLELLGTADPGSAARAVLQTGHADLGQNLQVDDDVLRRLEQGGRGRLVVSPTGNVEIIQLNHSDPRTEIDGERSSARVPHPLLSDLRVRTALSLLVDREAIQRHLYGRIARTTSNLVNWPPFDSPNTRWEFSPEKADRLLDEAGWTRGPDGVRARDGVRLELLFQTSSTPVRQKTQAIVKHACAKAGVALELKAVAPSVFSSTDPGNPDNFVHFYADLQMYGSTPREPDPIRWLEQYTSRSIAARANQWTGLNITRWRNDEYDRTWRAARVELDPARRAALIIRLNDLIVQNVVLIPVVQRGWADCVAHGLDIGRRTPWDSAFWNLASWTRRPA
jgi:peptide/nickel transport system substrate-binding protein